MKLISWDIGIQNLTYCILDVDKGEDNYVSGFKIISWNIINLMDAYTKKYQCCAQAKSAKAKSKSAIENKICGKNASCMDAGNAGDGIPKYYCKVHSRAQIKSGIAILPIEKTKTCQSSNKNGAKCKSVAKFVGGDKYYCKRHTKGMDGATIKKYITKENISFYEMGRTLVDKLNSIPEILAVDNVVIENQPVYKNPVMKSIQMIVYSFYLLRSPITELHLKNANKKLTVYDGPPIECHIKDTHSRNKKLAISYCPYILDKYEPEDSQMLAYFQSHKKKDDLADTYLQAIYHLQH